MLLQGVKNRRSATKSCTIGVEWKPVQRLSASAGQDTTLPDLTHG